MGKLIRISDYLQRLVAKADAHADLAMEEFRRLEEEEDRRWRKMFWGVCGDAPDWSDEIPRDRE